MHSQNIITGPQHDNIRFKAYWLSLILSIILLAAKFYAYKMTGSKAIMSDALESIINVIMPIVGLAVLSIARKPADKDHPYGHGKVEYLSSAIEGGLIFFAALTIIFEAGKYLIKGNDVYQVDLGLIIIASAGTINAALGFYVLRTGKKYQSIALIANGSHILSDVWTTVGVVGGLLLVKLTGIQWLDSVTALLMGFYLGYDGYKIVRSAAAGLLDEEDPKLMQDIAKLFNRERKQGIIHIHHTRVIRSGRYHHIDSHVVVPEFWDVTTAHEETEEFEHAFIKDYSVDGEIHFHLDPCRRAYCTVCDVDNCPVRKEKFKRLVPFTVESLISPMEPERYSAQAVQD